MKKRNLYIKVKHCLDIIFSFLSLIILLPFFILIAIAIKIDSEGPALYKQERLGKDGKIFVIYKFRSMFVNSENINNTYVEVKKGDLRITRVGKFLRKTSIDELPQLLNILKGNMSLIGPRPLYNKYEDFTEEEAKRFQVLPGITGLAQINGRKSINLTRQCQYDIEYVNRISLMLDIKIFIGTFFVLMKNNY